MRTDPDIDWIIRVIWSLSKPLSKLRFRLLGLATIKDIPTDRFYLLMNELVSEGWVVKYESPSRLEWGDLGYGKIKLRKGFTKLKLELASPKGSVEGPRHVIEEISGKTGFAVTHKWRWYDNNT